MHKMVNSTFRTPFMSVIFRGLKNKYGIKKTKYQILRFI